MSASYYIRRPFIVVGHKVTRENMAKVAEWCGGEVIEGEERTYIKVPVKRPTHKRQTEAWLGNYVVRSSAAFDGGFTYKVYTEDYLDKEFLRLERGEAYEIYTREFLNREMIRMDSGELGDDDSPKNRVVDNVRRLPVQASKNLRFKAH